jgi:hypothetical protein
MKLTIPFVLLALASAACKDLPGDTSSAASPTGPLVSAEALAAIEQFQGESGTTCLLRAARALALYQDGPSAQADNDVLAIEADANINACIPDVIDTDQDCYFAFPLLTSGDTQNRPVRDT